MLAAHETNSVSFIHKLDPRVKLLLAAFFTCLIFIVDSLTIAAAQMVLFAVLGFLSGIPLIKIFPRKKLLLFLIVLVIILQTLFGRESSGTRYLLNPLFPDHIPLLGGKGSLKLDGLLTGLMVGCRITALTVLLPVLTMTTEARLLACGLNRMGLPYRAAYVITSTLNLIPSFEEETRLIMDARKLRGVRTFEEGTFFAKLKEYPAIVIPLMIKAMRKAQAASLAMDARAFGAYKTRTWLLDVRMSARDYAAMASGVCYSATVIVLNFFIQK